MFALLVKYIFLTTFYGLYYIYSIINFYTIHYTIFQVLTDFGGHVFRYVVDVINNTDNRHCSLVSLSGNNQVQTKRKQHKNRLYMVRGVSTGCRALY